MKAAVNTVYGPADEVVRIEDVARPEIRENEVLVKVYATSVSTGAWRMVEMNARGTLQIVARMIFGFFRPRNPIQGGSFSGRVVAIGASVTRFRLGDEVFGVVGAGAHAEYVAVPDEKTIIAKPAALGYDEAAAMPFGGLTALVFLRDFAKVQPGQKVLVTGASGGVGVFAVQIAEHLGAEVTGLTSTGNVAFVKSLGADRVIDYKRADFTRSGETHDVILDTAGVSSFRQVASLLAPGGRFVPPEFGVPEILASMRSGRQGRRIVIGVNGDTAADLEILADLAARGVVRPVIDSIEPLANIVDAYRRVAGRHKVGAVVIDVDMPAASRAAA